MIQRAQRPHPHLHTTARAGLTRAVVAALAIAALAACSSSGASDGAAAAPAAVQAGSSAQAILDRLGMAGKDPAQAISALDQKTGERQRDILASVRYDTLVLKEGTNETSVAIPGGKFYLSVAPYVQQTHDCYFHSLTTCKGELAGKTINVTITDSAGQKLADGPVTTYADGFVGFWLPRDIKGTITVSYDGRTATTPIATGKDDPTCLTTLKLV